MPIRLWATVYACLIGAASAIHVWWQPASSAAVVVAGTATTAAVIVGVRAYRPRHSAAWLLLGAAVSVNAAGRVVYDALPGADGTLKPWSWIVWIMNLVVIVLLASGALRLARSTLRGAPAAIDAAIILLGAGLLAGVLIAIPDAGGPGVGDLWRTVRVGFVFRDVLLLAIVVHLATALRWSRSLAFLMVGLSSLVGYDVLVRVGRMRGDWWQGTAFDLLWMVFYIGVAAAALTRSMTTVGTPANDTRQVASVRIGLVAVLALIPSGVLMLGLFQRPPWYQPLIVIAATLILILALARIVVVAIQLQRQVKGERVLREAVTELAGLTDAAAVAPLLERAVGALLGPRARYTVAIEPTRDAAPDAYPAGVVHRTGGDPSTASMNGYGGALAIPMLYPPAPDVTESHRQDADGNHRTGPAPDSNAALVVHADRASLGTMRPRLEVLAAQAGFALERIRLNEDNVRHGRESYFRTLVQNSADVILIVEDSGRIRYASPSAETLFGSMPLIGLCVNDLVARPDRAAARRLLADARNTAATGAPTGTDAGTTHSVWGGDWLVHGVGETPARVEVSCRDLRHDPSIDGLVLTLRNVTEQRRLESELEYQAFHDPLTGLANRVPFSQRLAAAMDQVGARSDLTAVLYADIDDLKLVNDALGHEAGDAVLINVGDRLRSFVDEHGGPSAGMAARLSGDEFAVQLDHVADQDAADRAAAHLVQQLGQSTSVGGYTVTCSASVGVATTADAAAGPDLLRNADLALYAAKRVGKGQWRHYHPAMRHAVMARLQVRTSLERAIDEDALIVEYQPIVSLRDAETVGFEALLRWQHPTRGRLAPADFIDIAEESGVIATIGEWVLGTAMRDACAWNPGGDGPYVGVNVSARQFRTPGFTATVERLLATTGLSPQRLTLEITESLLLRDDHGVWQDIHNLRRAGVRVAIDDFGTGYSSLSYLRDVPLDVVKLDRSFTQSMATSLQQRQLVRGIVGLADVLGLEVVAEGIETEHEREVAATIGCGYGQGFLFSRPLPAEATRHWLTRRHSPAQRNLHPARAMANHTRPTPLS
ncbi:MAG TPA: EAL domain-containing protein [Micromonosporaceae bacterium]|nr:EAL domain-containing protein [Micromonosporaceae bacterium]